MRRLFELDRSKPQAQNGSHAVSDSDMDIESVFEQLKQFSEQFKEQLHQVIVGQEEVIDLLVLSLFCKGHVLLTGVPGLAKTLLIRSLSQLFHLQFQRIQCTPDLMPSDITGVEVLEETPSGERNFRFLQGPVFTNLLLADEINRTSPRTQAALLQAMQEQQVTLGGTTHGLSNPFIVFATQNPIDSEGTYPLPEAQLDRFLFNIQLDYPSLENEVQIAAGTQTTNVDELKPAFEKGQLQIFQSLVPEVLIAPHLIEWIVQFVRQTRPSESSNESVKKWVQWGAGVRASQNIVHAAKAHALLAQNEMVTLKDITAVLRPILRHRLVLNFLGEAEGKSCDLILDALLEQFEIPTH